MRNLYREAPEHKKIYFIENYQNMRNLHREPPEHKGTYTKASDQKLHSHCPEQKLHREAPEPKESTQ